MKKIYTGILCLCLPIFITAQNFAPLGTTWTYHNFTTAWYSAYVVEVTSEDSINGEYVTYVNNSSLALLDKGDKIYFYSEYNQQFNLLYDFTAEIGDTIIINGLSKDSIKGRSINIIMDIENDTACDDGLVRQRFKTQHIYIDKNGNQVDYELLGDIIEGTGCVEGLFPEYGLGNHDGISDIRCYNNRITHCQWVDYPCDTFFFKEVGTNNLTKEDVEIILSCNNGNCTLGYSLNIPGTYFFLIYNLQGLEIHRSQLVEREGTISWNTMIPGIHLWNIIDDKGRQLSGKILVE